MMAPKLLPTVSLLLLGCILVLSYVSLSSAQWSNNYALDPRTGLPIKQAAAAGLAPPLPPTPQQPEPSLSLLQRLLELNPFRRSGPRRSKWPQHFWRDNERVLDQLRYYDDQVVLRFNVSTKADEAALRGGVDRMLVDVWDFTDNYADIRIGPERRIRAFLGLLPERLRDSYSVLIPDVSRAIAATYPPATPEIDAELQAALHSRGSTPPHTAAAKRQQDDVGGIHDLFFQDYQPLSVITTWMRLLESMFKNRSGVVRMISLGKSYEGRDISALRVGLKPQSGGSQGESRRDAILVTGGLHAREWISTSTVNYAAWAFITAADSDPMARRILEAFDLIFVPVANPDGYAYTWEADRLWRKSRQPTSSPSCPGLDLDHAFGFQWRAPAPRYSYYDEECAESYGGRAPFEAVEARALADWARNLTDPVGGNTNLVGFLDFHSYSQQVLIPYEYSCEAAPPNAENLQEVAYSLAKHMRLTNGEVYTVASACTGAATDTTTTSSSEQQQQSEEGTENDDDDNDRAWVENRGGSWIDYVFHEFAVPYSYQIKLRDTGSYGFLLPSDDIVPTGREVVQAMKFFGDYLLGNNGHEFRVDGDEEADAAAAAAAVAKEEGEGEPERIVTELRKRGMVQQVRRR